MTVGLGGINAVHLGKFNPGAASGAKPERRARPAPLRRGAAAPPAAPPGPARGAPAPPRAPPANGEPRKRFLACWLGAARSALGERAARGARGRGRGGKAPLSPHGCGPPGAAGLAARALRQTKRPSTAIFVACAMHISGKVNTKQNKTDKKQTTLPKKPKQTKKSVQGPRWVNGDLLLLLAVHSCTS